MSSISMAVVRSELEPQRWVGVGGFLRDLSREARRKEGFIIAFIYVRWEVFVERRDGPPPAVNGFFCEVVLTSEVCRLSMWEIHGAIILVSRASGAFPLHHDDRAESYYSACSSPWITMALEQATN